MELNKRRNFYFATKMLQKYMKNSLRIDFMAFEPSKEVHTSEIQHITSGFASSLLTSPDSDLYINVVFVLRNFHPVAVSVTTYESEAIERLPEGKGTSALTQPTTAGEF